MKRKFLSVLLCLCTVVSILSTTALASNFTDVKSDAYYAKPVDWGVEAGVTAGTTATTFSPNNTCTRAQILTFLWRAAGCPKSVVFLMNPYLDISEDAYYYEAALWAKEYGMVQGSDFKPNTPCTRAAAVEYIWRYAKCPDAASVSFKDVTSGTDIAKAVSWAVNYGVTNGVTATTFEPSKTCTRGQIVTFLHRYFVEPLEATPAPAPAPSADVGKLDPLPPSPSNYLKHPDWYDGLTPADKMSNARIVAEMRQLDAEMDAWRASGESVTLPMLVRSDDLTYNAMRRMEIVRRYDRGINDKTSGLSDSARQAYNDLIAAYGDADPLRDYFG